MVNSRIRDELLQRLDKLSPDLQQRVLAFADALATSTPRGLSGEAVLALSGTLSDSDAAEIAAVIEADCECVDSGAW